MNYNCDKRNDRHFKKEDKYYRIMTDLLTYNDKINEGVVLVNKPNPTALYLNISDKALNEAKGIFNEIITPNLYFNNKMNVFVINVDSNDSIVFDFFESLFVAIIFACTAVEAFVNSIITLDYKEQIEEKGKKIDVDYVYVQRKFKLEKKIKNTLPKAYNYSFLPNEDIKSWEKFMDLIENRNNLIHLKQEELKNNKSTQLEFLMTLFGKCIEEDIVESAREIIGFISDKIGDNQSIPYEFYKQ